MTAPAGYMELSVGDLVLAASLLIANGAVSVALHLGLVRSLVISAVRMAVQLVLIAILLKFVFASDAAWPTVLFALLMLLATGYEVASRQTRRFSGWAGYALAAGPPFAAGLMTAIFASAVLVGAEPWYAPRYLLPILGMIVGNALAGAGLVLEAMADGTHRDRAAIEARLALGHTRYAALSDVLRRATHAGMLPILSTMATAGLVAIPGMMTGQILAGADPAEAAKYQIMILLLISGATGFAVIAAAYGALLLATDDRHRLRLDRLTTRRDA